MFLMLAPPWLWSLPSIGTPWLWYLSGIDTFLALVLISLWFWILPSSGLSLVLESHWCLDLAQEMCCVEGIDPDVTFAQLAILYTPGLGNSREDQEARRKQGL